MDHRDGSSGGLGIHQPRPSGGESLGGVSAVVLRSVNAFVAKFSGDQPAQPKPVISCLAAVKLVGQ